MICLPNGLEIETGIDLDALLDTTASIGAALDRAPAEGRAGASPPRAPMDGRRAPKTRSRPDSLIPRDNRYNPRPITQVPVPARQSFFHVLSPLWPVGAD